MKRLVGRAERLVYLSPRPPRPDEVLQIAVPRTQLGHRELEQAEAQD